MHECSEPVISDGRKEEKEMEAESGGVLYMSGKMRRKN